MSRRAEKLPGGKYEAQTAAPGRSPVTAPRSTKAARARQPQPTSAEHPGETGPVLDFRRSAVVLLATIANQIGASGSVTFAKRHGLSSGEWRLFATVAARPHIAGGEIAQLLGMDKAAVSRIIRALADRGLVEVGRRNATRKQQALVLTARGVRLHGEAIRTALQREQCLLATLSDDEQAVLVALLGRLADQAPNLFALAEQPPEQPPAVAAAGQGGVNDSLVQRAGRLERTLAELAVESSALRAQLAARA